MKDWGGRGEAYAASYAGLCAGTADALLSALGAPEDRSLLDVGAGTGLFAAAFADAGWATTACEPEPTMRAVAEREHPGLRVVDGALPDLPFAASSFDAVVANFVLNHVADPRASARGVARISAGLVAATIWTTSPSWLWVEVCELAGLTPVTGERLPPEKDFERTADGFERMLRDAGWQNPEVSELTWTWRAEPSALWASAEGGVGGAGLFYGGLDPDDRARFREAFERVCATRSTGGPVPLSHTAAIAVGRAR
ncbi:hypothetical protein MHM582_1410 [Microbacterium sp. HM58-2]|nr:hypothetical protein MHM582_1410 [Microbacterium sp. HM58-2]